MLFTRKQGDMIAIPFFAISVYYFANKRNRTNLENILLAFTLGGLAADSYWTINNSN